jgi:lambda family phage portal protein
MDVNIYQAADCLAGTGLEIAPFQPSALGGFEGASKISRELSTWNPIIQSPDQQLFYAKETLDARARDMATNDGYISGAIAVHKDSIVGGQYMLNSQPKYKVLGLDEAWADAFQQEVEAKFTLWAESANNWPDASRVNNLTAMVRLAVGTYCLSGEVLATAEWIASGRPYSTAVQMIAPDRLSNPNQQDDTAYLRSGIERNRYGEPLAYHIRASHPGTYYAEQPSFRWVRVPARKSWGRQQVIHIIEQARPDQSRGIADIVSTLKQMRMTQKFQDVTLQNAVLNATYAATLESELPPSEAAAMIGQGGGSDYAINYLEQVAAYTGNSRNLLMDGVKVPTLFPGTKFKLLSPGQPGGVGSSFEESLLRHIAASFGLSYEQFSRDYTKTNYSSARASMNETWKFFQSRKKMVADRFATAIFTLWFEEALNKGDITTVTRSMPNFYDGLNREAYLSCAWVGASRGQIDEMKETQAAILRIQNGLSTYEKEAARLGDDFRELFTQRAREKKMMDELGIAPVFSEPTKMKPSRPEQTGQEEEDNV